MSSDKNIIIDTGNIFGLDFRKALQNPNEEVLEGIEHILKAYCASKCEATNVRVSNQDVIYVSSGQELNQNADRGKLKLSVKLFLYPKSYQQKDEQSLKSVIDESIASILQLLELSHVDNLILSIQDSQSDQIMTYLKPFWKACEVYTTNDGKVQSLGTSDLNRDQLRELFQESSVKPTSSQINLDACCDIPEELSAFAKENSIKLLTHNDPLDDFVPDERIRKLLETLKGEDCTCKLLDQIIPNGTAGLTRKWIARYTLVLAGQGVLLSKGYLVTLANSTTL